MSSRSHGRRVLVKIGVPAVSLTGADGMPGGPDALRSALRYDVGTRFVQEPVGVGHG